MYKRMMAKSYNDVALLVLRIALGLVFIPRGFGKLFGDPGIQGFTGLLTKLSVPAPDFFAWAIALLEFFGGIGVVLGIFARPFAKLFAIQMIFVYFLTRVMNPGAQPFHYLIFAVALAILLAGAGRYVLLKTFEPKQ